MVRIINASVYIEKEVHERRVTESRRRSRRCCRVNSIVNSVGSQRTCCPALMSAPLSKSMVAILRWPLKAAIINAV